MSNPENQHVYQVVMPRLGLTMTEGKVVEWHKQDGELVRKGEPLFAIENEKSSLDIDSPATGILEIQADLGSVVPILSPVALIMIDSPVSGHHGTQVVSTDRQSMQSTTPQTTSRSEENHAASLNNIRATPRAKAEGLKSGIDLEKVSGTGIRGMITTRDVADAIMSQQEVKATPVARRLAGQAGIDLRKILGSGSRGMVTREDVEKAIAKKDGEVSGVNVKPLGELRSIISGRLSQSWSEKPQATLTTEADATLFVAVREQLNHGAEIGRIKISYNTMFIKVVAHALAEFPFMNASLVPEGLIVHQQIHIGLAVDTERGLMVPVLRDADKKSLEQIQTDLDGLVERTLASKNRIDDLSDGKFTITNLGAYEIDAFTPIINPPESGILGVGRIHQKPVGLDGKIVLRSMVALSLTFDHRVVDGAPAAQFLRQIKQAIEHPASWIPKFSLDRA